MRRLGRVVPTLTASPTFGALYEVSVALPTTSVGTQKRQHFPKSGLVQNKSEQLCDLRLDSSNSGFLENHDPPSDVIEIDAYCLITDGSWTQNRMKSDITFRVAGSRMRDDCKLWT